MSLKGAALCLQMCYMFHTSLHIPFAHIQSFGPQVIGASDDISTLVDSFFLICLWRFFGIKLMAIFFEVNLSKSKNKNKSLSVRFNDT